MIISRSRSQSDREPTIRLNAPVSPNWPSSPQIDTDITHETLFKARSERNQKEATRIKRLLKASKNQAHEDDSHSPFPEPGQRKPYSTNSSKPTLPFKAPDLSYLYPGFDLNTLTINRLRSILAGHSVMYHPSAEKPQLIELVERIVIPKNREAMARVDPGHPMVAGYSNQKNDTTSLDTATPVPNTLSPPAILDKSTGHHRSLSGPDPASATQNSDSLTWNFGIVAASKPPSKPFVKPFSIPAPSFQYPKAGPRKGPDGRAPSSDPVFSTGKPPTVSGPPLPEKQPHQQDAQYATCCQCKREYDDILPLKDNNCFCGHFFCWDCVAPYTNNC